MAATKHIAEGGALPAYGSRLRRILEWLPASNREIADNFEMHGGEVSRVMASLRHRGLVDSGNPGRGGIALYKLTPAARDAMDELDPPQDAEAAAGMRGTV